MMLLQNQTRKRIEIVREMKESDMYGSRSDKLRDVASPLSFPLRCDQNRSPRRRSDPVEPCTPDRDEVLGKNRWDELYWLSEVTQTSGRLRHGASIFLGPSCPLIICL